MTPKLKDDTFKNETILHTDHIGIVPSSRTGRRSDDVLVIKEPVDNVEDTVPGVLDIAVVTP